MKTKTKSVYEPSFEQGYKKKYLLRQVQEQEAKKRIREFDPYDEPNEHDYPIREED